MDVLSPWLVGRYKDNAGFDRNYQKLFVPDLERTHALGIGWAPVVFPGFSWSNLMRTTGAGQVNFNGIPRNAGKFWQHQATAFASMVATRTTTTAATTTTTTTPAPKQGRAAAAAAVAAGAGGRSRTDAPLFIYAAMFDELDEGTAMLKVVSSIQETPAEGQFLYYSADGVSLPSDFYLSLAGNFTARYPHTRTAAAATAAAAAAALQGRASLGAMSGKEPEAAEAGVWRESFRLARELTEQKLAARRIQQQQQQQTDRLSREGHGGL